MARPKHLLILPGLSSPSNERYSPVYDLLRQEARSRGYVQSHVLRLPGQKDERGLAEGRLGLQGAVRAVRDLLQEWERDGALYRILGLSFGATVAVATANSSHDLRGLERVVAWGPSPLWSSWRAFVLGLGRERLGQGTALIAEGDFFGQLIPVEHLLLESARPITVAAGTDDPYCPPYYVEFLRALAAANQKDNVRCVVAEGCGHNVVKDADPGWREYLSVVLE